MADELIDIFDENMNLLGTALKSQAHREGLWHKTFHCWLARKNDEGRVMVWLQLRNKDKSIYPDMLDVSAAGHVKSGEEVKDGYREVTEELGLSLQKDDLVKMFTTREVYQEGEVYNREFEVLYMAVVDNLLAKVRLQPEECPRRRGAVASRASLPTCSASALRRCWRAIWAKGPKTNSKPTASRSCGVAAATSRP